MSDKYLYVICVIDRFFHPCINRNVRYNIHPINNDRFSGYYLIKQFQQFLSYFFLIYLVIQKRADIYLQLIKVYTTIPIVVVIPYTLHIFFSKNMKYILFITHL